jgi:hypothetical protein
LLFSASKKHVLKELKDFKVYLAVIFGIAIGSISEEQSEKKKIDAPAEQRKGLFNLVESTLKELLESSRGFNWDRFFSMFPGKFLLLNLLKSSIVKFILETCFSCF